MMWQQNQYMDSGIQSGATTQAPSVSSKHGAEDMEENANDMSGMFDFEQSFNQGFTQDQVDGMYLTFPESKIILQLLYINVYTTLYRDEPAAEPDKVSESQSCHVPRDTGRGDTDPIHPDPRRAAHGGPEAGRVLTDAQTRSGQPDKLPG